MKLALDAGHWYYEEGRRCLAEYDSEQTREWTMNSRVCNHVEIMLQGSNCQVIRTDDRSGMSLVGINARPLAAANFGADVLISEHHNAGVNGGSGGGIVVCYRENYAIAESLYNHLIETTGLRGNRAAPLSYRDDLGVLNGCRNYGIDAFLIEGGFMDSSTDIPLIITDVFAQKQARGIVNFLVDNYGVQLATIQPAAPVDPPKPKKLVGAHLHWANRTDAQIIKIEDDGDGVRIVSVIRGLCLEVMDGVTGKRAPVRFAERVDDDRQRWVLFTYTAEYGVLYEVETMLGDGYVLDVVNGSTQSGAGLQTALRNGTPAQRFLLVPVPEMDGCYYLVSQKALLPVDMDNAGE